MHTAICDELGIEFPIFAFTHCRDVVVAVSKAGGFGVLGAVGFTPEQLEIELNWIDEHIGDHPYGVDIVIPNKYEGMDSHLSADELAKTLRTMVPQEHLDFAKKILADHGVPVGRQRRGQPAAARVDRGDRHPAGRGGAQAPEGDDDRQRARHSAGRHDQAHPRVRPQGRRAVRLTLAGAQARRRGRRHHHRPGRRGRRALRRGGLNRAVAAGRQGGRAGAGAGGGRHRQRPADRGGLGAGCPRGVDRLAVADGRGSLEHPGSAGGIRQGAAAATPSAAARSPVSRPGCCATTGPRPGSSPDNPKPLGMPLQYMVSGMAVRATNKYPNETVDVAFNPVGQVVGQFNKVEKTSTVIERWVQEYLEATNRLDELNAAAAV